ncbi:MAG: adenylate/guanylate cyclase domain-containing protein, partial [Gemmatimonadetes bacterium]|nr:adenylate/guanylate cyclase domain-containing protein [Gemmatimonadota bacterium]NIR79880.1 adenylate/guanylate cyclase domain-containing protein [Gemmatimonadota bacterium]NIT88597.1 adenylate/guanylate cyclase domain-containing protein [Gemmatimonadota bacterium]NIU32420.1 adenylate/guanylate cyclase domain-containing protein [Gemmatimonadota bacterium]NIU36917.1 adenylate/guanylate cyclase domain-containing protein [Gemmatimonadota bacterium]
LLEEWNEERARRGLPRIQVGVGVNAGEVVAGNMGSRDRLNYTVLGQTVNIASRLCSAAAPGEVLTTAGTLEGAGGGV